MYNYKLLIQYDGGRYKGWQRLGNGENTIQGKLENVISELAGAETEIIGASRTDAGVHALFQVANFKMKNNLPPVEVKNYLNKYLPEDISVIEVTQVPDSFHARFNTKDKTYLYKIWNNESKNPFMRKYSMHVDKKLDIKKMEEAAEYFLGSHDFTAFTNAKSKNKSMVREIHSISIKEYMGFIDIRVCGDGFLYNMVRRMAGTLIEVGHGRLSPNSIPGILESRDRSQAGYIAEACGLYLEHINFK
jgi:pseudouridylate synthase I